MIKQLRVHERLVTAELERLNQSKSVARDAEKLYTYHVQTVRDFQHERLVHLLVTLFFGGLFLLVVGALLWTVASSSLMAAVMQLPLMCAGILVGITEAFYIWHYYRLENGTQRLYLLSKSLYDLQSK